MLSLGIFSVATDGTVCPGVDSAFKNEYQDTPGGKDGRCVRVPKIKKIRSLKLPDPQGPAQACSGASLSRNQLHQLLRLSVCLSLSLSLSGCWYPYLVISRSILRVEKLMVSHIVSTFSALC
jgi:hypothetical protein